MEVLSNASSFTSPLAHAHVDALGRDDGVFSSIAGQLNVWTVLLSAIVLCVTYDQRG